MTLRATYVVDNAAAPKTWAERIDRTSPTIDLPTVPDPDEDGNVVEVPDGVYVAVGDEQYALSVDARDTLSGVQRVSLTAPDGTQVDSVAPQCAPECPTYAPVTLRGQTSQLTETGTYMVAVTDRVNRTTAFPVTLVADRVPPPPPSQLRVADYNTTHGATITWDSNADADLSSGPAGSGTASFEYRSQRLLDTWTAWTPTTDDSFVMTGFLAEPVSVEVRAVDEAGNRGPGASASLVVLPAVVPSGESSPSGGTNVVNVVQQLDLGDSSTIARGGSKVILRAADGTLFPASSDQHGQVQFSDVPNGVYDVLVAVGLEGTRVRHAVGLGRQLDTIGQPHCTVSHQRCGEGKVRGVSRLLPVPSKRC